MSTESAFLFYDTMKHSLTSGQQRTSVYLQRCFSYDSNSLKRFFDASFGDEKEALPNGAKVFIKPNLLHAKRSALACTHPLVILSLAEWFQDCGAQVAVGDSPAFGKARAVLSALGIVEDLEKRNIKIQEFERVVVRKLRCGVRVGIAAEPLEYDLFLNCAKLKAHNQMYVSLALKNIFGIIVGMRKSMLHMRHGEKNGIFNQIILDLIELLPRHLSVVDGIVAMSKEGPMSGVAMDTGLLAASADPVALDTSLLHTLHLDPSKSPLWREASRRHLQGTQMSNIAFPLCVPEQFTDISFEAPELLAPIRFNPFRFMNGSMKRLGLKLSRQ